MKEEWKPFPEWEEFYEISNKGRIKMLERVVETRAGYSIKLKSRMKKLTPNHKNKYLMVSLTDSKTNRHETILAHRIVAEAFIPNPEGKAQVNHLKTKMDITVNDLEWATPSENQRDAYARGLVVAPSGAAHTFARKVGRYLNGVLVEEYPTMADAAKDGFHHAAIKQAIDNNWKCGGYNWKFLSERKLTRRKVFISTRPIAAFKDGQIVHTYGSVGEVKKDGHDISNIYKALKNDRSTSGGYVWRYLENKKTA